MQKIIRSTLCAVGAIAFVLLSALDVISTALGLAHGAHEINPLVRVLIWHSGPLAFAGVKATTAGAYLGIILVLFLRLPGRWHWLPVAVLLAADVWLAALLGHNAAALI